MIKQICRDECTEQIKASNITHTKIHAGVDPQGKRYLVLHHEKAWEIHCLEKIPAHCRTLHNQKETFTTRLLGTVRDFSEVVDEYIRMGWRFYELDTLRDLPWWLAVHNKSEEL